MKNISFPVPMPNLEERMALSAVDWQGIIGLGPFGMPVANGRFGGPVWEENSRSLTLQFNHTDAFMYNDACTQTDARGGALGILHVEFDAPVFDGDMFHHLSIYDGYLAITAKDHEIRVVPDMKKDRVILEVTDTGFSRRNLTLTLSMLREPNEIRGNYRALSRFTADKGLMLAQTFEEKSETGISVNDFRCDTALYLRAEGGDQCVQQRDEKSLCLKLSRVPEKYTIVISGAADVSPRGDMEALARTNAEGNDFDAVFRDSQAWWHAFWEKSYVILPQRPHFEKRRNYFFYLAAICNRGKYPGKYNGGNWIGQGDRRDWGAWFWNWNQDSLFQPLMDANHMELMKPLFTMRESCFRQYETAARQLWGSKGIFIGETSGVLGFETLPENVAENLRKYFAGESELSEQVKSMGNRRNAFLTPWNWKLSQSRFSYVTHTMVATMETAEYFWMAYRYTKDEDFLRKKAYPFIRGAAEMYRNYYGFRKGEDGKYHFYDTNLHEHIWGGTDIIDDHALARGVFAVAIKASEILNLDADLRDEWRERLDQIAPYPNSHDDKAVGFAASHCGDALVWAQGKEPAGAVRGMWGTESPQFKMLEKFDVLNMETKDQHLDGGDWAMALRTYQYAPGKRNYLSELREDKNGSSRYLADVAKLGMAEDMSLMLDVQYQYFTFTPNLLHNEGDYYCIEGYGAFASGLQLALNQSNAPLPGMEEVIRVFPAWSCQWDAQFKLAAKGGFIVTSSMKKGVIEFIQVESQLGSVLRIRTPYGKTQIYRNGKIILRCEEGENTLLTLNTSQGDVITLVEY